MTPDNSRKTLYQKIWDSHVVREDPGQPSIIYIDRHLVHEGTSPQAFAGLRAEGAMRGGVAIAADKGLAGLRDAEFWADDVHDTLILAVHVEEANAGFAAVFLQGVKLELGIVIEDGQRAVRG